MDRRNNGNIDGGRIVVAVGAVLLLVALFLDWYGAGVRGFGDDAFSAWTSFEIVDLILALIAVGSIAAALEPLARGTSRLPEAFAAAAGPAALLLVLVSIINKPPIFQIAEVDLEIGAWLALAGAAIMCAGALLALNRVSLVVTTRDTGTHSPRHEPGRPAAAPAERSNETISEETRTRRM